MFQNFGAYRISVYYAVYSTLCNYYHKYQTVFDYSRWSVFKQHLAIHLNTFVINIMSFSIPVGKIGLAYFKFVKN